MFLSFKFFKNNFLSAAFSTKAVLNHLELLTMFVLFNVVLVTIDIGSDLWTAFDYYQVIILLYFLIKIIGIE
jgi:hypothetical protein